MNKEPDEVKQMNEAIGKLYRDKKVKHNYNNIETLPTVYDEDPSVTQEGFAKGFFSKKYWKRVGRRTRNTFNPKKWNASYVGPPLNDVIRSFKNDGTSDKYMEFNKYDKIDETLLKSQDLMNFFTENEKYLDKSFNFSKGKKSSSGLGLTMGDILNPINNCFCVNVFGNPFSLEYWAQYVNFFLDTIPCLIDEYTNLVIKKTTSSLTFDKNEDKDREALKMSIVEFCYLFVSCYLGMMFFYYIVIDPSHLVDPIVYVPKTGNSSFDYHFIERLSEYLLEPINWFNLIFTTFLPTIAKIIGVRSYSKLYYVFLFLAAMWIVFNGGLALVADFAKKSLRYEGHFVMYLLVMIAIIKKSTDFDVERNMKIYAFVSASIFNAIAFLLFVVIMIALALIILTPIAQFLLAAYIFTLFLFKPIANFFQELNIVDEHLNDPANETSCNIPSGEFTGELMRFVGTYLFPRFMSILLFIFFVYRLTVTSASISSDTLRVTLLFINFVGACVIVLKWIYDYVSGETLQNTVNLDPDANIDVKDYKPSDDSSSSTKPDSIKMTQNPLVKGTSSAAPAGAPDATATNTSPPPTVTANTPPPPPGP
jgi:hypothetical protein